MRTLLILSTLLATNALACYVQPPHQTSPVDDLIARTKNIALAQVTKAELQAGGVLYTFKLAKVFAGHADETFTIIGRTAAWDGYNGTFNNHTDPAFWEGRGRLYGDTDCTIHPSFVVGGNYLLFLDEPYHVKSFELIIRTHGDGDKKDKWLRYVETALRPNTSLERTRER